MAQREKFRDKAFFLLDLSFLLCMNYWNRIRFARVGESRASFAYV